MFTKAYNLHGNKITAKRFEHYGMWSFVDNNTSIKTGSFETQTHNPTNLCTQNSNLTLSLVQYNCCLMLLAVLRTLLLWSCSDPVYNPTIALHPFPWVKSSNYHTVYSTAQQGNIVIKWHCINHSYCHSHHVEENLFLHFGKHCHNKGWWLRLY